MSLITFGFTIYKFFEEKTKEEDAHNLLTPRQVGMIMIGMGILGLLLAQIDHYHATRKLKKHYPGRRRSVSAFMAILIWMFGLILFLATLLRE